MSRIRQLLVLGAACTAAVCGSIVAALPASAQPVSGGTSGPGPNGTLITIPNGGKYNASPATCTTFEAKWAYQTNSSYPGIDAGDIDLWYNQCDSAVQARNNSYLAACNPSDNYVGCGDNYTYRNDGASVYCSYKTAGSTGCNDAWLYDAGYTSFAFGDIIYPSNPNSDFGGSTASY